jgi:hypothetical protein
MQTKSTPLRFQPSYYRDHVITRRRGAPGYRIDEVGSGAICALAATVEEARAMIDEVCDG